MPLTPNTLGPDFSLPDQNGTLVSLTDLIAEGPAVVFFYPKDDYSRLYPAGVLVSG